MAGAVNFEELCRNYTMVDGQDAAATRLSGRVGGPKSLVAALRVDYRQHCLPSASRE